MTKTITIAYRLTHEHRKHIFVLLFTSILLTAFAYAFLLQKAIFNLVERQKVVSEERAMATKLADLEEKYFALKNTVTLDLAEEKGFSVTESVSYISKKPRTAMAAPHEL
jgi:hypothetical protein